MTEANQNATAPKPKIADDETIAMLELWAREGLNVTAESALMLIERIRHEQTKVVPPALIPVEPIMKTRFKLSFDRKGRCITFRQDQAEQLFGEWVWLIEATDGKNVPLYIKGPGDEVSP